MIRRSRSVCEVDIFRSIRSWACHSARQPMQQWARCNAAPAASRPARAALQHLRRALVAGTPCHPGLPQRWRAARPCARRGDAWQSWLRFMIAGIQYGSRGGGSLGLLAILGLVPLSLPRAEQTLPPWTIRTPPPLASDATWRWRLGLDIDRMCHLISRRVHHLGSHLADSFSRTDQTIQDPHHAGR